jgi:hypothetical protein
MRIKQPSPDILIIRVNTLAFLPGCFGGTVMFIGALYLGGALLFASHTIASPIAAAVLVPVLLLGGGGSFYFALHAQRSTWEFNRQKNAILLRRASVLHSETHELPLRNAQVNQHFGKVTLYAGGQSWTIAHEGLSENQGRNVRRGLLREVETIEHFLAQSSAQSRQRELDTLAPHEDAMWEEVFVLIEQESASSYDRATKMLVDLRDLAARQRQQATFEARLDKIVSTYADRAALLHRLRKAGLVSRKL